VNGLLPTSSTINSALQAMQQRSTMKALITGAQGMLAADLIPCLQARGYEIIAHSHSKLDITDESAVRDAIADTNPTIIFNCAAYTKVDQAENEQASAEAVNGLGVKNLCLACRDHHISLVHFSTDYVFDSTQETPHTIHDIPNPINAYGHSKRLGEEYILDILSNFYLVRTSWLFGLGGRNFVETILDLGRKRGTVSVVTNETGCPTWTKHLAQAVAELVEQRCYGIYHVTNSEPTTWYNFAAEIFRLSSMNVAMTAITSADLGRPAKRPSNSILDPHPLPQVLGRQMPSWKEALREYLTLRRPP